MPSTRRRCHGTCFNKCLVHFKDIGKKKSYFLPLPTKCLQLLSNSNLSSLELLTYEMRDTNLRAMGTFSLYLFMEDSHSDHIQWDVTDPLNVKVVNSVSFAELCRVSILLEFQTLIYQNSTKPMKIPEEFNLTWLLPHNVFWVPLSKSPTKGLINLVLTQCNVI